METNRGITYPNTHTSASSRAVDSRFMRCAGQRSGEGVVVRIRGPDQMVAPVHRARSSSSGGSSTQWRTSEKGTGPRREVERNS